MSTFLWMFNVIMSDVISLCSPSPPRNVLAAVFLQSHLHSRPCLRPPPGANHTGVPGSSPRPLGHGSDAPEASVKVSAKSDDPGPQTHSAKTLLRETLVKDKETPWAPSTVCLSPPGLPLYVSRSLATTWVTQILQDCLLSQGSSRHFTDTAPLLESCASTGSRDWDADTVGAHGSASHRTR